MTVSGLADKSILSPNGYFPRAYTITRLTPHHTACVATAEQIAGMFASTSRQASCNYAIGYDGSIVCVFEEQNAPWTSANWDNDNRAITFEISDCDYDWNISDAAIEAYINLCVDLIQRYPGLGGEYNYTGDLDGNVTFHKWFAATACPGPHLGSDELQSYIQSEVNRRLRGETEDEEVKPEDIGAIVNALTFKGEPFNSAGMYYKGHVENIGWDGPFVRDGQIVGTEGQSLRLEAIHFMPPNGVTMTVSAYYPNEGWTEYEIPSEGAIVGTEGEGKAISMLSISADVPVRYRCHVSNIGWQDWKSNGESAGALGERIEAFQLVIG